MAGSRRLNLRAITAVARKMGVITTPATGIDILRDRVAAWLHRSRFSKSMFDELHVDSQDLIRFSEGSDCLSPAQTAAVAKLMLDATLDPVTGDLRKIKPQEVTSIGRGGPVAVGRPFEEIVGDGVERVGLVWSAIGRAPTTVHDAAPPKPAPSLPARRPGWA